MNGRSGAAYDAVVVGSGPNGLAAAIALASAGCSVVVYEAAAEPGGGLRSSGLTLPGFVHDICAAVLPLGIGSPFLSRLPLGEHGLEWIHPEAPLAHPFDDGGAAILERSVVATGDSLGEDGTRYADLMDPLVSRWEQLAPEILAPLHFPRHPISFARFGLHAIRSARGLVTREFTGYRARALLAGISSHAVVTPDRMASAAFGLTLAMAGHAVGWPVVRGGSGNLAAALVSCLRQLGGDVVTDTPVTSLNDLPAARIVMLDLAPRHVARIAGDRLPPGYRRALERYRYGPGVFKIDWALSEPIPWRADECRRAGTVHIGGTLDQVADAEAAPWLGVHHDRPFVLLAQPTLFDPSRAPPGQHTAWAYCHVPNGSDVDMTARIEAQVERFAPGFGDVVLARHVHTARDLERHDANFVGGDIGTGENSLGQLFFRPVFRRVPYSTPVKGLYICSSATPPGGGAHGMCGFHAAQAALAELGWAQQI